MEACVEGPKEVCVFEEAFFGAGGCAGVGQMDGNVLFFGCDEEVWPDFGFDEDDGGGAKVPEV